TSSAFNAIRTIALMRSPSVGVHPVVGSGVLSLTEKIPNCMTAPTSASIEVASPEAIMGNSGGRQRIPHPSTHSHAPEPSDVTGPRRGPFLEESTHRTPHR